MGSSGVWGEKQVERTLARFVGKPDEKGEAQFLFLIWGNKSPARVRMVWPARWLRAPPPEHGPASPHSLSSFSLLSWLFFPNTRPASRQTSIWLARRSPLTPCFSPNCPDLALLIKSSFPVPRLWGFWVLAFCSFYLSFFFRACCFRLTSGIKHFGKGLKKYATKSCLFGYVGQASHCLLRGSGEEAWPALS